MAETTLTYLLPRLRLHIGDIDSTAYRYLDTWLELALLASVETLQRWWNYKYLVNYTTNGVYRNPNIEFVQPEPPVIEDSDNRPIILMASIITKSGSLQNFSWNLGSWRDNELAYSNIEGGKAMQMLYKSDWEELTSLLVPPKKKLTFSKKMHLPGYKQNPTER